MLLLRCEFDAGGCCEVIAVSGWLVIGRLEHLELRVQNSVLKRGIVAEYGKLVIAVKTRGYCR